LTRLDNRASIASVRLAGELTAGPLL